MKTPASLKESNAIGAMGGTLDNYYTYNLKHKSQNPVTLTLTLHESAVVDPRLLTNYKKRQGASS